MKWTFVLFRFQNSTETQCLKKTLSLKFVTFEFWDFFDFSNDIFF